MFWGGALREIFLEGGHSLYVGKLFYFNAGYYDGFLFWLVYKGKVLERVIVIDWS